MVCKVIVLISVVFGFNILTAQMETEFYEHATWCPSGQMLFEISAPSLIACLFQCGHTVGCRSATYHPLVCYGCNAVIENNIGGSQTEFRIFVRVIVPSFTQAAVVGEVTSSSVDEASGLAASHKHPGTLYTHNDSGGGPVVYVLTITGDLLATLTLSGVTSHDWEDMAIGPCGTSSAASCVYIGDIGYGQGGSVNRIFRFPEPDMLQDQTITVDSSNSIAFSWEASNAETLLVDPDANVYIISTNYGGITFIATVPHTAWGANERIAVLSTSTVMFPDSSTSQNSKGGDISPSGDEILVKTAKEIYYWNTVGSRDYLKVLQTNGTAVPYLIEPKGDGVCWDSTGSGYFTLSEGRNEPIYFYQKLGAV